ncbi:MAG: 2-oxoglutarate and iron-dependent oxygenase domain-containing protein [Leptolyngbyaceae cyanobacterium HOT.MB2.61]|nr:2-oxoglutarate and iron-dependent oxygenase domain-containing protein [Leptolyngbyaceae cyanobacterium HOT.MB2.61]
MIIGQTIPVIDLQDFCGGDRTNRQSFVDQLGKALAEIGFFALVNHGIDPGLVQTAYQVAQKFPSITVDAYLQQRLREIGLAV